MIELERIGEYAVVVGITIFFYLLALRIEFIYKALKDPNDNHIGNDELIKYQKRISRDLRKLIKLNLWQAEQNGTHETLPHHIKTDIEMGLNGEEDND